MKLKKFLFVPLALALVGCGGGDSDLTEEQIDANIASDNAAMAEAEENAAKEVVVNPLLAKADGGAAATGDAPPPLPGEEAPVVPEMKKVGDLGGFETSEEDGSELPVVKALQAAVDTYTRAQSGGIDEPGQKILPELTSIEQLVTVGMIKRLPPAPPGKKFALDEKGMVVVVDAP